MTDLRQLITANAGCGKTWTLANQCIGWMIDRKRRTGDADPTGLVAATFTRNAAGEILHRVLEHLAVSALDQDALSMFVDGFNVDPEPTPEEMNEVLADVAKAFTDFSSERWMGSSIGWPRHSPVKSECRWAGR